MRFGFLKAILTVVIIAGTLVAVALYLWGNPVVVEAVIATGIVALANVLIGCWSLEYSIDKSTRTFMLFVFGGMGLRMAAILVAFALLLVNGFDALTLSLSLMGFYVVFMIAELYYVVTELNKRSANMYRKRTSASYKHRSPRPTISEFSCIDISS